MFDPRKVDPELGREVEAHLQSLGFATPTFAAGLAVDTAGKIARIKKSVTDIMMTLGLDLSNDSLAETPERIAKMYVGELMWGLLPENFPKVTTIENSMQYDEMLIEKDITVMSLCEHHFVTIEGKCHIAYFPGKKVAGLSKFNRVVEYFARRPQVQERLTSQIIQTLKYILDTEDVAVVIEAKHYCVISRGVEDESSETITSASSGRFRIPEVRAEFMSLIK